MAFFDPLPPLPEATPTPTVVGERHLDEIPPEPMLGIAPEPIAGGALRLAMRAPVTFNPLLNEDITVAKVLQLMFEPLVILDDELRIIPHLAHLEFAFNGASVVVNIRDDAYWSDGTEITAHDLIFSINTLRNAPEGAIYRRNIENIAHYDIINDRSVRITFGSISGGSAFMFNFPIIPRHHFQASPNNFAVVSNGPFMFESFIGTEMLHLVQNPYNFRSRPNIEEVHVLITDDMQTDRHAFDRGLIDIYLAPVPEWARHRSVRPVQFAQYLAMQYEFIGFNFARTIPRIPEFRQAIAHALDVENLVESVFLTHAMVARSPVHPASSISEPNTPRPIHDMDAARTLALRVHSFQGHLWPTMMLEETEENEYGEEHQREVLRPLQILVNKENVEGLRIAEALSYQMNEIGFPAEVYPAAFVDFIWFLENGHFDLFIGTYNLSLQPDLRFAFHSESPNNLLSLSDSDLDRLLDAAAVAGTDILYYRAMGDVQLHIAESLPVISLAFRHGAIIADPRLQGNLAPKAGNIFARVEEWHIVH